MVAKRDAEERIEVAPNMHLRGVAKEHRAGRHGKAVFVALSRDKKYMLVSQKLKRLMSFISEEDPTPISLQGMFGALNSESERHGGYYHFRWKLLTCPLSDVPTFFEGTRDQYESPIILGCRDKYALEVLA